MQVSWRLWAGHTAPRVALGYGERTSVVVHGGSYDTLAHSNRVFSARAVGVATCGGQGAVLASGRVKQANAGDTKTPMAKH